jgi:hypothetical protein
MTQSSVIRQSGRIVTFNKYNQSFYFILKDFCTDIVRYMPYKCKQRSS